MGHLAPGPGSLLQGTYTQLGLLSERETAIHRRITAWCLQKWGVLGLKKKKKTASHKVGKNKT